MPRWDGRQTTRVNHLAETPKQYWRISLYYGGVSIFWQFDYELETRLFKSKNRFHAQHLLPRAVDKLTDDHVATIYEAYQADIYLPLEDFRREVARWRTHWVITKRNDLPTTLWTTLDYVNSVLYPSIDTILIICVLLTMSVASATSERSFSVLRCLKNYARSNMKNDRLSFLGLVHIHRDFEVDLYKAMEVFVSAKTRRADFGQF
jgi:hypothetical protein